MSAPESRSTLPLAIALVCLGAAGQTCQAQCDLLIRESFRPGPRPHGNNGRLREAGIHDTLKDYWPQVPSNGTRWLGTDQSGMASWGFAGSSLDPAEIDPLDPYNGTAFGEATAAALLPFTPPTGTFTLSAEVVQLFGSTSATYIGYTSGPSLFNNFESLGALWMSLNGRGEWAIRANGSTIVASGTAPIVGTLDSGWLHVELTLDPVHSMVWGRVMDTPIAPTPVSITTPILYFGIESHESWNVVNNISVFTGSPLEVSVVPPAAASPGANVLLEATTNAADPAEFFWTRNGLALVDGAQPWGTVVSGSRTAHLSLAGVTQADVGEYTCTVANSCGLNRSASVAVTICAADFNADGAIDFFDYDDFVVAFETGTPTADFNHDTAIDFFDYDDFVVSFETGC
ncbi:MAG: immunoglobulin domain-containing protein [Planctomycetota bacterium]